MPLTPNLLIPAFLLGLLLITLEFHRPGLILPGCLGLFLALYAAHALTQLPLAPIAVALILLGFLLLLAELRIPSQSVLPALGAIALTRGLLTLTPRTNPILIAPLSLLFASIFTFLTFHARRARENKRLLARK